MTDPIDPDRVYTTGSAAPHLLVSPPTVASLCKRRELRAADVSRNPGRGRASWRIRGRDLLAFLDERTAPAKPKPAAKSRRRQPAGVREFYPAA